MANTQAEFWSKVEITDGCWLWKGGRSGGGYGAVGWRGEWVRAHRLVLIFNGTDIEGKIVHHTCHTKHCVRPDHLQVIETKEEHVRLHAGETCKHGHPRTPENTSHRYKPCTGYVHRECLACRRLRKGGNLVPRASYTHEDAIVALKQWAAEHGRQPDARTWARTRQRPGLPTIQKIFGSWSAALGEARFVPLTAGKKLPRP